jgi:predicted transcriptional regulator
VCWFTGRGESSHGDERNRAMRAGPAGRSIARRNAPTERAWGLLGELASVCGDSDLGRERCARVVDAIAASRCGLVRLGAMTRITIELPDEVAARVSNAAAERGVAPEQLAGEVLAERFPARKLRFARLGRSTTGRRAAEDEEMLAEGFGR